MYVHVDVCVCVCVHVHVRVGDWFGVSRAVRCEVQCVFWGWGGVRKETWPYRHDRVRLLLCGAIDTCASQCVLAFLLRQHAFLLAAFLPPHLSSSA